MKDNIEQSIVIRAPIEKVYQALSDAREFGTWWNNRAVEGDFHVGSQPILDEGEYGRFRIAIVAAEPHSYFAFRWVSGMAFVPQGFTGDPLEHPNTLVEFRLESVPEGTRVDLKESGFASLPPEYAAQNLEDNTGGWDEQMERLRNYLQSGKAD
ncbi:MAG: SRPBCC family protein [Fimbriimonadaceae bacterium]|nr:SRPBCC family protein [Fimbriimonadaceae bacterium]